MLVNFKDKNDYWNYRYGSGPFEVIECFDVPVTGGTLGFGPNETESMQWEQGKFIRFRLNNPCQQFLEYDVKTATFHEKWLVYVEI